MNKCCEDYRNALESLVPGGSEFVDDPNYCAQHVLRRREEQHAISKRLLEQNKQLRFLNDTAKATIQKCESEIERLREENLQLKEKAESFATDLFCDDSRVIEREWIEPHKSESRRVAAQYLISIGVLEKHPQNDWYRWKDASKEVSNE